VREDWHRRDLVKVLHRRMESSSELARRALEP